MKSEAKPTQELLHKILSNQSRILSAGADLLLKIGLRGKPFDALAYSEWRGGLIEKGINPKIHAALYGIYSRVTQFKSGIDNSSVQPPKPDRDWVLVVTHDQSRTGAPILALSLVNELAKNYNVATVALGSGVLANNFAQASNAYFKFYGPRQSSRQFSRFIQKASEFAKFKFAIVNSMEAAFSIESLSYCNIPCIALIHEYSSYGSRAKGTLEGLKASKAVVFSSSLTRDSMIESRPEIESQKFFVIPQGKCEVPQDAQSNQKLISNEKFKESVDSFFNSSNGLNVIGAGYVQYRKGLDLFVTLASLVTKVPGLEESKFLWVGDGYSTKDANYGLFVYDQIARLGLADSIRIIPSSQYFTYALQRADALALTSRLDPLPNVVIDAIFEGKHIVCFDKASGFPELFKDNEVLRSGVAGYLDLEGMARKLTDIGQSLSSSQHRESSAGIAAFAESNFSFSIYTNRLVNLFD